MYSRGSNKKSSLVLFDLGLHNISLKEFVTTVILCSHETLSNVVGN